MKKLTVCRTATILCGLLAIAIHAKPDMTIVHLSNHKLIGAALGLISAIFATQWIEYKKRQDAVSTQPGWSGWVRRLLYCSLLGLTVLTAGAQTNWTAQPQLPNRYSLFDMAYGAGRYVTVGDYGLVRVSTDGEAWTTLPQGPLQVEGLSGIVYGNNRFVVVGYKGGVMTSTNGLTWTKRVSGTNEVLQAITYGGGTFVGVGMNGILITSTDGGTTWTKQVSGTTEQFTAVAYGGGGYGGNLFVAVGVGIIKTSPDGITWTTRTLSNKYGLGSITTGPKGNFVAVGGYSVLTSPDGLTWTSNMISDPVLRLKSIAYSPAFNEYVSLSSIRGNVATSTDGVTWKALSSGTNTYLMAVRCLQGKFFVVGEDATIRSSPTGFNWKPVTLDPTTALHGAAFGNGRYVAVGANLTTYNAYRANLAITSADGVNYTVGETIHPNGAQQFNDVAFGNGLFAAVGEDALIQTSTDGKVWEFRQLVAGKTLNAVAYGGGQFIAIGENGFLARSNDGKIWNSINTGLAKNFKGISYANGQFTAVGQAGAIATSSNGLIWVIQPSITDKQLKSVTWGNGKWVAVGYDGVVLYKIDGLPWLGLSLGNNVNFNHVIFANGQFVAVGLDGKIYSSPNGIAWAARESGTNVHLWSLMHSANQFVAVGEPALENHWTTAIVVTSPNNNPAIAQSVSPIPDPQARLAVEEARPEVGLKAIVYPNPVADEFTLTIDGASGQPVQLRVFDLQGRTIMDRQIQVIDSSHQESMRLDNQGPGTYLLQVSTTSQTKTIKVLKQ
ncbi:hypothetical protein BH09BAC4_BH09BAC4_05180 [soil metagenome]